MRRLNTLTAIKSIYPETTSPEKSIANFILEKPEEIYRLNIQELAARSGVSLPTVFRFAKRLEVATCEKIFVLRQQLKGKLRPYR
jgi:DNA-binding MurR/RpiR family transcriptional regulator